MFSLEGLREIEADSTDRAVLAQRKLKYSFKCNTEKQTMSEKNNQLKTAPQAEKEKRQQRKLWHQKGQHGKNKKKDPEAIPVLKYGPGNNFAKFKEEISKVALKEYGD